MGSKREYGSVEGEALLVRYAADVHREWHASVGTLRAFNLGIVNGQWIAHVATFAMLDRYVGSLSQPCFD